MSSGRGKSARARIRERSERWGPEGQLCKAFQGFTQKRILSTEKDFGFAIREMIHWKVLIYVIKGLLRRLV